MGICKLSTYFKQNWDVFCAFHWRILICTFISLKPEQMHTVYLLTQIGKFSSGKFWFALLLRHHFKVIMDICHLKLETSFRSGEGSHISAETCLYQFLRARYAQVFPTLYLVILHKQLEIGKGVNSYTMEISECCKSELSSSLYHSVYQTITDKIR